MDKEFHKRYLISLAALYGAGLLIFFALLFALSRSAFEMKHDLSALQMLGISALSALVPAGAYCGAVCFFKRFIDEKKPSRAAVILLIVFLPAVLVLITAAGVILIIPTALKSLRELRAE